MESPDVDEISGILRVAIRQSNTHGIRVELSRPNEIYDYLRLLLRLADGRSASSADEVRRDNPDEMHRAFVACSGALLRFAQFRIAFVQGGAARFRKVREENLSAPPPSSFASACLRTFKETRVQSTSTRRPHPRFSSPELCSMSISLKTI